MLVCKISAKMLSELGLERTTSQARTKGRLLWTCDSASLACSSRLIDIPVVDVDGTVFEDLARFLAIDTSILDTHS